MTVLSVLQNVAIELGLAEPSTGVGNTDTSVRQMLGFMRRSMRVLKARHDWQALTVSYTWTTTPVVEQDVLPSDYDRLVYNAEIWDRSRNQCLSGPTRPNDWMLLKSGTQSAVTGFWRLLGNAIHIWPAPPAGLTYEVEYVSNEVVLAGASTKTNFTADTDTFRIPEDLITLDTIWRFRKAKGFDYGEDLKTAEHMIELACSRDRAIGAKRKGMKAVDRLATPTWPGIITTS